MMQGEGASEVNTVLIHPVLVIHAYVINPLSSQGERIYCATIFTVLRRIRYQLGFLFRHYAAAYMHRGVVSGVNHMQFLVHENSSC
jgi:hypothetical protein